MESINSESIDQQQATIDNSTSRNDGLSDQWFNDQFENLLPKIQERWPSMAKQTIEATQGSLDELVRVISQHSGKNTYGVKEQLDELFNSATNKTKDFADSLEPLEKQLEELLDELNHTLRPKIEKPIRQRPILAIGIAAGVGILLGLILSGRKSQ
tara:strand:- start:5848 stop:6315 length:468 start_codon:yes stop_codon:yes gene_type:complete